MEPHQINVIIYAARNLQPKKGSDVVCRPYVVFGVGKDKFQTEYAKGKDPTWNEESTVQVTKSLPLTFTVKDREEVLGNVTVPLAQISSASLRRWEPLTKKNVGVGSELSLDCWVTSYQKKSNVGTKWSFKAPGILRDPTARRRSSIQMTSVSLRGSRSMENLHSTGPNVNLLNTLTLGMLRQAHSGSIETESEGAKTTPRSALLKVPGADPFTCASQQNEKTDIFVRVPEIRKTMSTSPLECHAAPVFDELDQKSTVPEITGLSPKFGPISGGTRITLRGRNLGNCLADIVSLSLCGCELLPTLEYHSSTKLVGVTRPWNGCGPVVIVTKSGGRGTSTVKFSFENEFGAQETARNESNDDVKKDGKGRVSRSELLNEITRLRGEVLDLSADNERLRKYIDLLVVTVMEKFPHVLENLTATL